MARSAAVLVSLLFTNLAIAIDPAGFNGSFFNIVGGSVFPAQCQNMGSAGAATLCACNFWSGNAGFICPGLWSHSGNNGLEFVPDAFGNYHCTLPDSRGCGGTGGVFVAASPVCPSGSQFTELLGNPSAANAICTSIANPPPPPHENLGKPDFCTSGNPINQRTGNKIESATDYQGVGPFPLVFTRYYNSDTAVMDGSIGARWRHTFDRSVNPNTRTVFRPDGKAFEYTFSSSTSTWTSQPNVTHTLVQLFTPSNVPAGWKFTNSDDDSVETYDANGRLVSIASRTGIVQTLSYDSLLRLSSVIDSFGRSLTFTYGASSRVSTMTDPAGNVFTYAYDSNNNLSTITYPDTRVRAYPYEDVTHPFALTGIVDENGNRYATFAYDVQGRATSSQHAGGANGVTLVFNPDNTTTETDALNTSRTYTFQTVFRLVKNTAVDQPCVNGCGLSASASTYDSKGFIASSTDWNGNRTNYTHDTRGLETSRTEGLTSAGGTTAQTRTISTQWHPMFRLPVGVAEPLRITSYVYNGDGGASCGFEADGTTLVPGVLCSKTIQPTTDATGAAGFGATATGSPRTWNYAYNANGSVLTMDGSRTDVSDVTTYTYYANNDADLGKRGNIATITNALGQVTNITAYNAHGQPLTIVDPNGLTTTLAYDPRLRLTSRSVGGELTSYTYDGVGQLTQVTLPDGSSLTYSYDAAHRLTAIGDNLGNKIAYTLDAMGNRTQEQVLDPANALAQTRSRVFNNLNRLARELGAQNQTTQYAYDNQGNVTSVTDPLNHVTANAYDALNRLIRVTDPNLGQSQYGYNGIDQLVSVTDPRNLTTSYNYDGLANLNQQSSPDTGATQNIYDSAGNLLTQTDAKGQVTRYAYDALNRVTSISFADGSKQSYGYDQGANGIGRLTSITETDPQSNITSLLAYGYDQKGRATSETRTIGGMSYVLAYSYDGAGRLAGMSYPSGRTVSYAFDALGRISQVSTTPQGGAAQIVASNVAYQPFGGVKGYTLGNGQSYSRSYDLDGRIASYSLGTQNFAIGYDAASRISFITDAGNPANANTYGYDVLDRLTSAVLPNLPFAYSYDAVGNRTSKTVGSATDDYAYSGTSNRLSSITRMGGATRSFGFDANGSTVNDGINGYVYDTRGRLVQTVGALGATTYQVNALGQRIRKTNSGDDRVFLYDTRGRLIAETTPAGQLLREYLYLNDIPLAVIQ